MALRCLPVLGECPPVFPMLEQEAHLVSRLCARWGHLDGLTRPGS